MASSQPLRESDLIFSSFASSLKTTLSELKRTNLSIKNRLRSIKQDSQFVCEVADAYKLPLVANERCGSWYIPPDRKAGSAYFKSTDGHFGQWAFSLRRLNLQVLDVIGRSGGCVIVDSTRRGKVLPDALSKTVPIWMYVMNRLIFPDNTSGFVLRLSAPLYAVSESEYAQIAARLEEFVQHARELGLDLERLRSKLNGKPMKATWVKPGESLPGTPPIYEKTNLLVLCTASNQTSHETSANSEYVQGAADDPESWSLGLDATMFWKHQDELLRTSEDELPTVIEKIMMESNEFAMARQPVLIHPTNNVYIANNAVIGTNDRHYDVVVSCTVNPSHMLMCKLSSRYIVLACTSGKTGSRQLRKELDKVGGDLNIQPHDDVLVTCETGKDLAVGAALALLCLSYMDNGSHRSSLEEHDHSPERRPVSPINKTFIRQRLSWIMASMPDAAPSRATLQSVNSFLMG